MPNVFLTEPVFSADECKKIIESADTRMSDNCCPPGVCRWAQGDLEVNGQCGYGLRDSIRLVPEDNPSMFEKFYKLGKQYNDEYFHFEIDEYPDAVPEIFINRYMPNNRNLDTHADWGHVQPSKRKITIGVPLSSADSYEGGVLSCYENIEPIIGTTQQGAATVFPVWVPHDLGHITSGVRYSAIGWITGAQSFR